MKMFVYACLGILLAGGANAQSAIEHHVWQDARSFQPMSRTASAITGAISLSGNPDFASEGSTMTISFENGSEVGLISKGASWRTWDIGSEAKQTAEVFRLDRDPGVLLQGNTLCGDTVQDQPIYVVFHESLSFFWGLILNVGFFQSQDPPRDINSSGLCGTFSYAIEQAPQMPILRNQVGDAATGGWNLSIDKNPIDDSKTVILSLVASEGASSRGEPISFFARCKSTKTEVYTVWGDYQGDDSHDVYSEWKNVIVRVGGGEARIERWGISTNRKATFAPSWAGNFLKELLDQERLVLQTTPYGKNPKTAIFDVTGLRNVLGELASTCNWSF